MELARIFDVLGSYFKSLCNGLMARLHVSFDGCFLAELLDMSLIFVERHPAHGLKCNENLGSDWSDRSDWNNGWNRSLRDC